MLHLISGNLKVNPSEDFSNPKFFKIGLNEVRSLQITRRNIIDLPILGNSNQQGPQQQKKKKSSIEFNVLWFVKKEFFETDLLKRVQLCWDFNFEGFFFNNTKSIQHQLYQKTRRQHFKLWAQLVVQIIFAYIILVRLILQCFWNNYWEYNLSGMMLHHVKFQLY